MRAKYSYPQIARERLWGVLLAAYCACLIISNVLAAKVFVLREVVLPCGVIIFPVVYILNDMLAELFDWARVRKGILFAFGLNLLATVCIEIACFLPGIGENLFAEVLGSSWRVLIASFAAYLIGTNSNAWIMHLMHEKDGDKRLFNRCLFSTIVGEFLDALVFIYIAFYGTLPTGAIASMILAQAGFKIIYEAVAFPLTRLAIKKARNYVMEGVTE